MRCCGTGGQLFKLVPIIHDPIAAGPSFLGVVKDGFAGVVAASSVVIFFIFVLFSAAMALALLHFLCYLFIIPELSLSAAQYITLYSSSNKIMTVKLTVGNN